MTPAKGHLEHSVVNKVGLPVLEARRPHSRDPGVSQAEGQKGLLWDLGVHWGIRGEDPVKHGSPLVLSESSMSIFICKQEAGGMR